VILQIDTARTGLFSYCRLTNKSSNPRNAFATDASRTGSCGFVLKIGEIRGWVFARLVCQKYLQVRSNGQIVLPAPARRRTKLNEGDLLEVIVEQDGSIRLDPKLPGDRALAKKYQLADIDWALKHKGKK
jgi:AbrB family looped-hinge helix DNA binding protein